MKKVIQRHLLDRLGMEEGTRWAGGGWLRTRERVLWAAGCA